MNNGFTADLFQVRRGVRQGDPLSPLLFILAIEILATQIRQDDNIHGVMVKNEEIKLTLFADDMTCFLNDINSYLQLCRLLEDFYKYSGLRINNDKTELFAIGSIKLAQHDFIHDVRTSINILGTFFDHHKPSRNKANFESIWKGNDKIKRSALINDIDNGGLKMLDIESMISAQRVMALKKYFADGNSSWKTILDEFLCNVLFCNFDTRKLPVYIPAFYKECLDAWSELKNSNVVSYEDVIDQIIWNNKNIVVDKQSLFEKHLFCQGIVKIGDLLSNTGKFL